MLNLLLLSLALNAASSAYRVDGNVITVNRFRRCAPQLKPEPIAPEMLRFFYQQLLDQLGATPVQHALVRRDSAGRIVRWFAAADWGKAHLAIARDPEGRPKRITLANVGQAPVLQVASPERIAEIESLLVRRFANVAGDVEDGPNGYGLVPLDPDVTL